MDVASYVNERTVIMTVIETKVSKNSLAGKISRVFRRSPWKTIETLSNLRIVTGPLAYSDGVLTTKQSCDFVDDEKFNIAYHLGKATNSWGNLDLKWRAYNALYFAQHAAMLPGDFVECGVNRGGLVRAIIEYINFENLDKRFFLLDTFDGLADEYVTEEEIAIGATNIQYEDCYEFVKELFAPYPNVVIVRGTVPDTLTLVDSEHVAFLSIDMNCVEPELAAVEFFWDEKLVKGGIVLLDDYGWPSHIYQKRAFDTFAADRNIPILTLPTGQGVLIKA